MVPPAAPLPASDAGVVAAVKHDGMAVLHNLFSEAEVTAARCDFDALYAESGKGGWGEPANAAARQILCTCHHLPVGATPGLARLFSHPRIVAIVQSIMACETDDLPLIELMRCNRYMPAHPGMSAHSDGGMTIPFATVATQIFLDPIDAQSGAIEYCPGSHTRYFAGQQQQQQQAELPRELAELDTASRDRAEIERAHEAGRFTAVECAAGSVTFRMPQVWHAGARHPVSYNH